MRISASVAASQFAPEAGSSWSAGQRATWGLHSPPGKRTGETRNGPGRPVAPAANVAPAPFSGCKPDLGANWNDAGLAGLFACNLNNPASNANINIGCRLATRARSRFFTESRTARDLGLAFPSGQENRRNTNRAGAASSPCGQTWPRPLETAWRSGQSIYGRNW